MALRDAPSRETCRESDVSDRNEPYSSAAPHEPGHVVEQRTRRRFMRGGLLPVISVAALALVIGTGEAKLYKWVDENGIVHYTDKIPTDAVDKSNVELNKQAVPIRKMEA